MLGEPYFADDAAATEHLRAWSKAHLRPDWELVVIVSNPVSKDVWVYGEVNGERVKSKLALLDAAREAVLDPDETARVNNVRGS